MPEWYKEKPPTLIISDCGHVPTFLEKCGVKSLDEIPVQLPIVNWNWTLKSHRPYMDYPVIKERIPLPEGVSLEQLARAEAEWQKRKERLKSESRYSSDSSRE